MLFVSHARVSETNSDNFNKYIFVPMIFLFTPNIHQTGTDLG